MPPEPHGPEDDGISHPPLQPADPQGGEGARRTQGEVEGQVQEGDGPGGEEEGSGERLAGHQVQIRSDNNFYPSHFQAAPHLRSEYKHSVPYLQVTSFLKTLMQLQTSSETRGEERPILGGHYQISAPGGIF